MLKRLHKFREALWLDAGHHPDRSGRSTAAQIADRRAEMLRVFLLAGRSPTRAIAYLKAVTGEEMSRQAFTRQMEHVERVTRLRLLRSRISRRQSPPKGGV